MLGAFGFYGFVVVFYVVARAGFWLSPRLFNLATRKRIEPKRTETGDFTLAHPSLEGLELAPRRVFGTGVKSGDDAFDDDLVFRGDAALVLALLDADARRFLRRLVIALRGRISDGRIVVPGGDSGVVRRYAEELIAKLEATRGSIERRLADHVESGDLVPVRVRNLELLLARAPGSPDTARALQSASVLALSVKDEALEQLLARARALGDGRTTIDEARGRLALAPGEGGALSRVEASEEGALSTVAASNEGALSAPKQD